MVFYFENYIITTLLLSYFNHIISAYVNIGSHEYRSWCADMNIGCGVNIGCGRCFCVAFNNKFALFLIPSFINSNQSKVEVGGRAPPPPPSPPVIV